MTILQFQKPGLPARNQDVKDVLRELYERAMRDEIHGMMWVVCAGKGEHESGLCGRYRAKPDKTIIVAEHFMKELGIYTARKLANPLALSKVL